jgi:hypothetical protein
MSKQNKILYVNERGTIEISRRDLIEDNIIITIDIDNEIKKIIKDKNIKIAFCDKFLSGELRIKNLEFVDNVGIQIIGSDFLSYCSNSIDIDLSGLSNVIQIGDNFLCGCDKLMDIDLSILSNVTRIGDFFLENCKGLIDIDLSVI